MKYLIFIALSVGSLHAMDLEKDQLKNASITKSTTNNSETYFAQITNSDKNVVEYTGTQFFQENKKGSKITCTCTKIGKFGSEITNELNAEWFNLLKSLHEQQNNKKN